MSKVYTAKLRLGAFNDAGCDAVVFVNRNDYNCRQYGNDIVCVTKVTCNKRANIQADDDRAMWGRSALAIQGVPS